MKKKTNQKFDIIEFRKALIDIGISQNKLAGKIGIHPQMLSQMVNGHTYLTHDVVIKICRELKVNQAQIFDFFETEAK